MTRHQKEKLDAYGSLTTAYVLDYLAKTYLTMDRIMTTKDTDRCDELP